MSDFKKHIKRELELRKLLNSLPQEPPMGWAELSDILGRAQQEGRSIDYYNADGKFKLKIGKQPKRLQPRCGARTRSGAPCKMRVVAGKTRCRLHGGMSTGPKTAEGRARIVESNRRRAKQPSC
jgi:hypothetical protein